MDAKTVVPEAVAPLRKSTGPVARGADRLWRKAAPVLAEAAPALLVALCAAPAAAPLFRPGFPDTHDGRNHLFHLASLAMSLADHPGYVRWSGQLDLGYGSPIFSYYAPLPYYGALAFTLFGLGVTDALRCFFAAGILLSALATYALARELGGRATGFAAGVSAAIVPYQLHDVYVRGALGEAFALALMPLPLLCMLRFARSGRRPWLAATALGVSAIALSHNVSTLLSLPVLALWIAILAMAMRRAWPARGRLALELTGSVALGLGMAAFFWLPAIADTSLVHLDRATANYNFHDYFNRVWPPLQVSPLVDYRYDPRLYPVRPGLAQVALALLGVGGLVVYARGQREVRGTLWLGALVPAAALVLFLQRPASAFLWEHVPLAPYVQFPYRLMGPFGLATALLTGFVPWLARRRSARLEIALGVGALGLITSLVDLHPAYTTGLPPNLDERGLFVAEAATGNLGFTASSEYVPEWVTASTADVIGSATRVPAGTGTTTGGGWTGDVKVFSESGTGLTLDVMSSEPRTLVLHTFYMPQWRAKSGRQRLPTHPFGNLGLLAVDVPAGTHRIEISYGFDAIEVASYAIAAASAALCLAVVAAGVRRAGGRRALSLGSLALAAASLATCAGGARLESGAATLLDVPTVELAPGFRLAGAEIDRASAPSIGSERVALYILTQRAGTDLVFRTKVTDERGRVLADATARPWNGSTAAWAPGEVGRANIDVPLPGGEPASNVTLTISAADSREPGHPLGSVALPPTAIASTPPRPYRAVWANFGDAMAIRGYQVDLPESSGVVRVRPGQTVAVTLDMLSLKVFGGGEQETVFVHMLDGQGKLQTQHDELAGGPSHPTSRWLRGEPVRQQFAMILPPDAPSGPYRFEVGFYQLATMQRLPLLDATGKRSGDALQFGSVAVGETTAAP